MSLKDLIRRDIDKVFMNPNDFCDNLVNMRIVRIAFQMDTTEEIAGSKF